MASTYLPDGWRQWKIIPHAKEDLLGSHLDPLVLNKISFKLIVASLAELKPLLLSRKEASRELADNEDVDDSSTLRSTSSKSKKLTRIDKLEQNFSEMKDMLSSIMGRFSSNVDDDSEVEAAYPSSDEDDLQEQYPSRNETLESSD